jgi:hypothetical protein
MCRVTRHHTQKHGISTEELEAKLGIHRDDIRHHLHSRAPGYSGHVFNLKFSYGLDADRTPPLLWRCQWGGTE